MAARPRWPRRSRPAISPWPGKRSFSRSTARRWGSATTDSIGLGSAQRSQSCRDCATAAIRDLWEPPSPAGTDYAAASSASSLTIAKASLTVTANDATKVYGSFDPAIFSVQSGALRPGRRTGEGLSGWARLHHQRAETGQHRPCRHLLRFCRRATAPPITGICYVTGTLTVVPNPSFALNGPEAGTFAAGQTVIVQWTATNVDVGGPTKISLAYAHNATAWSRNATGSRSMGSQPQTARARTLEHGRCHGGNVLPRRVHV